MDLEADKDGSSLSSDDIEKVTVRRPGILFQDDHLYLLKYKSVEVGQTVSWSYKQTYDDVGWAPFVVVPNRDRVTRQLVEVHHPAGVKVHFELFFPRQQFRPTIARSARKTSIVFSDLPHPQPLNHFGLNGAHVVIWPQAREGDLEITPISRRGFLSWHARRLRSKPQAPLCAADKALLAKIIAGASSPKEKLKQIYDWVRKNVRYVADERGLHGNVPHAPSYVLKKRFGDCKDLSNLVIKLAAAAGVETVPVFAGVGPKPRFAGVNDRMYDHQLRRLPGQGPLALLRSGLRPLRVWQLAGDGHRQAGAGRLRRGGRPPDHPAAAAAAICGGCRSRLELTACPPRLQEIILRNERFRQTMEIKRLPEAKQRVRLSKMLSQDLYKILLSKIKVEAVADDHAKLSAQADLSEFVVKTDRRLYLPMVAIRAADRRPPRTKARPRTPSGWTGATTCLLRVKLAAPGYKPRAAPPLSLGSEQTATVRSSLSHKEGGTVAEYRFWQHRKQFAGQARERPAEALFHLPQESKEDVHAGANRAPGRDRGEQRAQEQQMRTPTTRRSSRLALALTLCAGLAAGGCAGRLHTYTAVDMNWLKAQRGRVEPLMKKHADEKAVFLNNDAIHEDHVDFGTGHWTQNNVLRWTFVVIDPKHKPLAKIDWVDGRGDRGRAGRGRRAPAQG